MAKLKNGYADLGNNHHAAVYRLADGSIESEIVSLFEAADRLRKREPVVRRQRPDATFLMSLGAGDALHFPDGERKGLWIVQGVWAAGPIVLLRANDAEGTSVFRPTAGSIIKAGGRKVAIDPIGRIRRSLD
jgi:CRISPR-associated endonuclease Csn1